MGDNSFVIQSILGGVFFAFALTRKTGTVITKLDATNLERLTELFGALTVSLAIYFFVGETLEIGDLTLRFYNPQLFDQAVLHWSQWIAAGIFMGLANKLMNFCAFGGLFSMKGVTNWITWVGFAVFLLSANLAVYVRSEMQSGGEYWGNDFTDAWRWISLALYIVLAAYLIFLKVKVGIFSLGHFITGVLFGAGFAVSGWLLIQIVINGVYIFENSFSWYFLITAAVAFGGAFLLTKFAGQSDDTVPQIYNELDARFFVALISAGIGFGLGGAIFYIAALRFFTCCHLILWWVGFVAGCLLGNVVSPFVTKGSSKPEILENLI